MTFPKPQWLWLVNRERWVQFRIGSEPTQVSTPDTVTFENDEGLAEALAPKPPLDYSEYAAGVCGLVARDNPGFSGTLPLPDPPQAA